jgi:hypothetical protein
VTATVLAGGTAVMVSVQRDLIRRTGRLHSGFFFRLAPSWTGAVLRRCECAQAVGMDPPAGTSRYAEDPHRCARRHACGRRFHERLRGGAVGRCSSPSPCREDVSTARRGRRRPGEAGESRVVSQGLFGHVGRRDPRTSPGIPEGARQAALAIPGVYALCSHSVRRVSATKDMVSRP